MGATVQGIRFALRGRASVDPPRMAAMGITSLPAGGAAASGSAPAPDGLFSIGDMARALDASQRTLRFYRA